MEYALKLDRLGLQSCWECVFECDTLSLTPQLLASGPAVPSPNSHYCPYPGLGKGSRILLGSTPPSTEAAGTPHSPCHLLRWELVNAETQRESIFGLCSEQTQE